jgi:ParB/RepB/Spo0J family partition protein
MTIRTAPIEPVLPHLLHPGPNYRVTVDPSEIEDLAASIAIQGLLQNLVVTTPLDWTARANGVRVVVAGERRRRAIGLLVERGQWPADRPVPCAVVEGDAGEMRALSLVENLQRAEVDPLDEADAFATLQEIDLDRWTTAEIARAIGRTQRFVQQRLQLARGLVSRVRTALRDGLVTLEAARHLATLPGAVQVRIAGHMLGGELMTLAQARALAEEIAKAEGTAPEPEPEATPAPTADQDQPTAAKAPERPSHWDDDQDEPEPVERANAGQPAPLKGPADEAKATRAQQCDAIAEALERAFRDEPHATLRRLAAKLPAWAATKVVEHGACVFLSVAIGRVSADEAEVLRALGIAIPDWVLVEEPDEQDIADAATAEANRIAASDGDGQAAPLGATPDPAASTAAPASDTPAPRTGDRPLGMDQFSVAYESRLRAAKTLADLAAANRTEHRLALDQLAAWEPDRAAALRELMRTRRAELEAAS